MYYIKTTEPINSEYPNDFNDSYDLYNDHVYSSNQNGNQTTQEDRTKIITQQIIEQNEVRRVVVIDPQKHQIKDSEIEAQTTQQEIPQIQEEIQPRRVIIIDPQNINSNQNSFVGEADNNNNYNIQFDSNVKKYGIDEIVIYHFQNLIQQNKQQFFENILQDTIRQSERADDSLQKRQINTQRVISDDINQTEVQISLSEFNASKLNINESLNNEQSIDGNQAQINDASVQKYTLEDVFFKTSTGPVFSKPKINIHEEEKPEFMHQFGGSMVLYFKNLKLLAYCAIFLAIICQFQIILNVSINFTDPSYKSTKWFDPLLYSPSIAPIASINRICDTFQFVSNPNIYNYTLYCPQGTIDVDSIIFGQLFFNYAGKSLDCQLLDPFFDIERRDQWKKQSIENILQQCDGKDTCQLNLYKEFIQPIGGKQTNNTYYIANSCKGPLKYLSSIYAEDVYLITVIMGAIYTFTLLTILFLQIFFFKLQFSNIRMEINILFILLKSLKKMKENFKKMTQAKMVISSMYSIEISPFNFLETRDEIKDKLWEFVEDVINNYLFFKEILDTIK